MSTKNGSDSWVGRVRISTTTHHSPSETILYRVWICCRCWVVVRCFEYFIRCELANVAYYYYCRLSTNDCRHGMCSSVISESNCCVNPFSFVFDGNTHPTYVRHLHNWSLRLMMFTHHTHSNPLLTLSYSYVGLYIRQTINYRISTISSKRFEWNGQASAQGRA